MTPVFVLAKTVHALDGAATVIGDDDDNNGDKIKKMEPMRPQKLNDWGGGGGEKKGTIRLLYGSL
jgi:hypothetical protein